MVKKELKLPCQIAFCQEVIPEIEDISLFSSLGLVLRDKDLKEEKPFSFTSKLKKILKNFIP